MVSSEQILLKERMNRLLKSKDYNITKLAEGDENLRVRLGRQFNNNNVEVQFDTLFKLLYMFHDIDARWLIVGEGFMKSADNRATRIYATNNTNTVAEHAKQNGPVNIGRDNHQILHDQYVEMLQQENMNLKAQIAELKHDKERLEGLVDFFKTARQ